MKRFSGLGILVLSAMFLFTGTAPLLAADEPVEFSMSWQPEQETFVVWYAKEKGWDKEEGLDFKLNYFESGMAQLEALPAKQWVVGGMGGVPATVGALCYGTYVIAIGNDESETSAVLVRDNRLPKLKPHTSETKRQAQSRSETVSPILGFKGFNPKYPEVYGSPELIKGKTILCTTVSSGHFAMSKWLEVFGLKTSDVVVKNMDQAQALAVFESGIGDAAVFWAPHLYTALAKGWTVAGNTKTCGGAQPIVIVGDKNYCDKNPETVAKFLRVYLRGINLLKKEGVNLLLDYKRFYKDWAGLEMTDEMAKLDIQMHPVFTYDEQLKLFDASKGPSTVEQWQLAILDFFTAQGKFKPEEKEKVLKVKYITDKFLKLVKQPTP
jgi:ABC-type nitrate/sulfonate/bicarbonate transport system substrate-binding protein